MKKILLIFVFYFTFCGVVFAEITRPLYTIDYKPQVIFGDTVTVGDYRGLENYVAEYVGGYLHIKYTTTHSNGGWASYPSLLYIRSNDPSLVNNTAYVYTSLVNGVNTTPSYPTDFYFVDIQFSAVGYREVVTRGADHIAVSDDTVIVDNMDADTFIALANDYPKYDPPMQYSMSFQPMRLESLPPTNILSFEISTSTKVATVHDYIRPSDVGSSINFNISNAQGQFYVSPVIYATTTGDLYYTWNYPELTKTKTGYAEYTFYTDITNLAVLKSKNIKMTTETPIIGYPGHSSINNDSSEPIRSSYNHLIQTLGTGLSGTLGRIDIQTSNSSYGIYGSRPMLQLFECIGSNYSGQNFSEQGCIDIYSGESEDASLFSTSTQSFYPNQIVFNPSKYYYFTSQGNSQYQSLTKYYGSSSDTVDGTCYEFSIGSGVVITPCRTISDLYFRLYGITKVTPPTCISDCFSNVLFLPGLEASRLYLDEGNSQNQLWEPNRNLDVEKLFLNEDGTSKNSGIYTMDVIKETNTPVSMGMLGQNIYKSFTSMMEGLVADKKINRWESYAYDWRQSVQDIVDNGTQYSHDKLSLIALLQTLVETSKTGKVTIVGHSNGGLLAKALLVKLQEMKAAGTNDLLDKVDVLILVAVPQIGTASAVPAMLNGFDQAKLGGLLVTTTNARELGRSMPSAYGLLPSSAYLKRMSASPITFADNQIPSGVTTSFIEHYGNVIDSYLEYKDFLFGGDGRKQPEIVDNLSPIVLSPILFGEAETLHNKIDVWTPPIGLRVIEVAGWGLDTVASFQYYPKWVCDNSDSTKIFATCRYVLDEEPIFTMDGDRTVVEPSALYTSTIGGVEKYWVDIEEHNNELVWLRRNREHKDILEIDQLDNFIKSIIQKTDIVFDTVLTTTKPIDDSNRLRISIHSPVTLGAYDSSGNFTGKVCPTDSDFCYAKEEIPNSSYLEFGEGKYLNLPEENMQRVVLQGTDIGTFTYESEKVLPDDTSVTTKFIDIPVTSQTTAEIVTNPNNHTQELKLDTNGDKISDITIQPSNIFDPVSYLQVMRKTVEGLDITKARKNGFLNRIDNTIKAIQKEKIDKVKLKVERFTSILDKRIDKKDPKKSRPHMLTKTDAEQLLIMLDTLLNNLN